MFSVEEVKPLERNEKPLREYQKDFFKDDAIIAEIKLSSDSPTKWRRLPDKTKVKSCSIFV